MAKFDSRRTRRMMKQMGLKMNELRDIDRVILLGSKREIVIEDPSVTVMNLQGQQMYQITGGNVSEKKLEKEFTIPEEDILLVSQQAGVSMEKAKEVLEDTEGDLAKAILILSSK